MRSYNVLDVASRRIFFIYILSFKLYNIAYLLKRSVARQQLVRQFEPTHLRVVYLKNYLRKLKYVHLVKLQLFPILFAVFIKKKASYVLIVTGRYLY
jgi:hypothetical protein